MTKNLRSRTSEFIEKSIKIHGDKFDYSKVEYIGSHTKVCIICLEHGEFHQSPSNHLLGKECLKCSYKKRGEKKVQGKGQFIEKSIKIHGDKYDYSKVEYNASKVKVCIICREHGEFLQTPDSHLQGQKCPKCSGVHRYDTNEWIEKIKEVHGERYDYSKVEYVNNSTKVCIICKEHGEFWQTPANHIKGKNCPKCTGHFMDMNFFLDKAKEVYKDKNGNPLYDYSLVDYNDSSTHVTIICHKTDPTTGKEHGEFSKTPNKHLSGQGCPSCGNESGGLKNRLNNDEFLKKAFTDKYEYLTEYVTAKTKIHIQCKKCGHKFWQEAFSHLSGCGCPICNESKLEKEVTKYLNEQNIRHEKQKRFEWLGRQSLDFYLSDYNIAIECQGIQHFEPLDFFGGDSALAEIVKRDDRKLKKCLANNISMIYVIDNEEYRKIKYHFDIVEPFSGNASYEIIHINYFENHINRLVEISHFLGL